METNLKYINQICVDLGGTGGHILNVQGENEICTLLGGTGGHSLEINALNEICTIQGVTAGHSLVLNALNAIAGVTKVTNLEAWKYIQSQSGSVLNQIPDGAITTKDGKMIVLTVGSEYILTVEGFVPLNALRTISRDVVKTNNLDFITT